MHHDVQVGGPRPQRQTRTAAEMDAKIRRKFVDFPGLHRFGRQPSHDEARQLIHWRQRATIATMQPHEAREIAPGVLEVITGPMFSGKSEELIRRLKRARIARQRVACFKPDIDLRYHRTPMYNSVIRADDQMLVTPHLYGLKGYKAPLMLLQRLHEDCIFDNLIHHFDRVWATATPMPAP